jgi:hypothetical protein
VAQKQGYCATSFFQAYPLGSQNQAYPLGPQNQGRVLGSGQRKLVGQKILSSSWEKNCFPHEISSYSNYYKPMMLTLISYLFKTFNSKKDANKITKLKSKHATLADWFVLLPPPAGPAGAPSASVKPICLFS